MFRINLDQELTIELLQKMINKFNISVSPKLRRYKNYYDGIQDILQKSYNDPSKPCNRSVTNFCKNITDSYCGYLASAGYISYTSEHDIDEIMNVLRYNDYQTEDSDFLLDALVYGTACELMYTDNEAHTRFKLINPTQCFGIYDDSLTNDLLYFVRFYKANDWDDSDVYNVDVYSERSITHYTMHGKDGYLKFVDEQPHYFNQCPANIFMLPDEKSIFDCVMSLQDSYNELSSGEIDDYSAFCDAYLALTGVDAEEEDIAAMKENRVMILPEGASANYIIKQGNDTQIENQLKRIQASIYRVASCPDFSSESFVGGVSSGIAIRYRLTGMETRAAAICSLMKKALQRRIELICGMASLKLGEELFRDIKIDFKRNIPDDENSTVNLINSLRGLVSDETLLGMIPGIDNPVEELERINKQKESNMQMYDFGSHDDEDNEENE